MPGTCYNRIRKSFAETNPNFAGEIEVDETYFGGRRKNMYKRKRVLLKGGRLRLELSRKRTNALGRACSKSSLLVAHCTGERITVMVTSLFDARWLQLTTISKPGEAVVMLERMSIEPQIKSGQYWTVAVPCCLNCGRQAG